MNDKIIDSGKKLCIIIPAYNEERNIAGVIKAVRNALPEGTIVVVNDGSKDKTAETAISHGATVLSLPVNVGYGAALQTGFKYSLKNGFRFSLIMDADGQHIAEEAHKVLTPVMQGIADLAVGSRYSGDNVYRGSMIRMLGSLIFSKLASWSLGFKVTDPTSGFQAMNRRTIEFFCSPVYPSDFPDADILIATKRAGLKIVEVPVKMLPPAGGKSMHSGLKPFYYIFKMFFSIFVTFLRKDTAN